MNSQNFEEWIHNVLETYHTPTDNIGWLKRVWDDATNAACKKYTRVVAIAVATSFIIGITTGILMVIL